MDFVSIKYFYEFLVAIFHSLKKDYKNFTIINFLKYKMCTNHSPVHTYIHSS